MKPTYPSCSRLALTLSSSHQGDQWRNHQAIAMAIRDIDGTENCGIAFLRFLPTNIFFGPSRGLIVLGGLFNRFTFPVDL